jgi:hypothetical protein
MVLSTSARSGGFLRRAAPERQNAIAKVIAGTAGVK